MWPSPIDDFSNISLWLLVAFGAGLACYAVVRALAGTDRRRISELQGLRDEITALAADKSRLSAELASASQQAAIARQLDGEVLRLRRAEEAGRAAVESAVRQEGAKYRDSVAQLTGLRDELQSSVDTAQYYQDEYDRLAHKHDELAKVAYAQSSRVAELEARLEAAASQGNDVARLRSDLERARAEIVALRAAFEARAGAASERDDALRDGIDPELYESEVSALLSTVHELRNELSVSEGALNRIRDALGEGHHMAS